MQIKKILTQGQPMPFGYAYCYYDYVRGERVAYPVGLCAIVGWAIGIYYSLHRAPEQSAWAKQLTAANVSGFERGREFGYSLGLKDGLAERAFDTTDAAGEVCDE